MESCNPEEDGPVLRQFHMVTYLFPDGRAVLKKTGYKMRAFVLRAIQRYNIWLQTHFTWGSYLQEFICWLLILLFHVTNQSSDVRYFIHKLACIVISFPLNLLFQVSQLGQLELLLLFQKLPLLLESRHNLLPLGLGLFLQWVDTNEVG